MSESITMDKDKLLLEHLINEAMLSSIDYKIAPVWRLLSLSIRNTVIECEWN